MVPVTTLHDLGLSSAVFAPLASGLAYLDPGSGSFLLQLLLAGILGGLFVLRSQWAKVKGFFRRAFSRAEKPLLSEAARAELTALRYSAATVGDGSVIMRCPACGAENTRRTGNQGGEGVEGQWTGLSLKGLPMSRGVQWTGVLVAIVFLVIGLFPVAIVLGLLFLPFSPLLPVGQYLFGWRAPIYLTDCRACGRRIAFAGEGDTFLAADATPKMQAAREEDAAAPEAQGKTD
jgi:hypothetical protein